MDVGIAEKIKKLSIVFKRVTLSLELKSLEMIGSDQRISKWPPLGEDADLWLFRKREGRWSGGDEGRQKENTHSTLSPLSQWTLKRKQPSLLQSCRESSVFRKNIDLGEDRTLSSSCRKCCWWWTVSPRGHSIEAAGIVKKWKMKIEERIWKPLWRLKMKI